MSMVCIPRRTADDTIPITVLRNSVLVRLDSAVKLSSFLQPTIQPLGEYVNKLISPWTKWTQFGRRQFPIPFFEWKWQNYNSNFTEICSQEPNWRQASIGSSNGLAPERRQAITRTDTDLVHWWRICGTRGRWASFHIWPCMRIIFIS